MSAAASEAKVQKNQTPAVIKGEMPNLRAVYCALTTIVKA